MEIRKNQVRKRMPKYLPLKADESPSLTPDDEPSEATSPLSTPLASAVLPDALDRFGRLSRSSATLISYTSLSSEPSSSSSRSSTPHHFEDAEHSPLHAKTSASSGPPTSGDRRVSLPRRSASSSSISTSSESLSSHLAIPKRRNMSLTLPLSPLAASSSIGTAILGMAKTVIAPSKIPVQPDSLQQLLERRNQLMSELIAAVGTRRANNLFVNHAQQWHYLLVYAEEDSAHGTQLREMLKEVHKHGTVAGPWETHLGDQRLDVWQRLLESSTMVFVLLSRALLRDEVLGICFPGTLIRRNSVVPLFVEPLEEEEITPSLKPIIYRSGVKIYSDDWNMRSYVQSVYSSYCSDVHYGREVALLTELLEEVRNDVNYVCRCRRC
ncbi:uncharacterized protein LOC122258334 isoform X2 [Penaeus japonicus]|nr:uncharacterized protein LOC122258334 isoform X2 [Penaeus japonicus]XP_042880112.1 uncharacterized protein LOC122258334 isoform X2 [Penaeus japonicus]XP_042880113.1 uncharacterized protein LOC122258334 isoform X2 [Penaeus japonicus]XP_042880114.1 uncharacterized protein LOC122258334 isoform X2 [Penaeus japonicus]XP_042880116.1 uncharacterized protein LOC122258334 isoform X2 [Penaeus japonicus]XP_042880117.1 uncharacterized protein LOC122258334 isoform X2 [Penaeus japonicus]XP_042880118.1 un